MIQLTEKPAAAASSLVESVAELRGLALSALQRMYRPEQGLFAFRLRREAKADVLEGVSCRYTAIVLLALAQEAPEEVTRILTGHRLEDVCACLSAQAERADDFGEVALTLWAARVLDQPAEQVLARLRELDPVHGSYPTVELSWVLAALAVAGREVDATDLRDAVAQRLLASFHHDSGLFPHGPAGGRPARLRAHVACFADLVYPIQALSHYHRATGNARALEVAQRCAQRMCDLQGPAGQWWWHFDVRTGRVLEKFPVYAVHQDAMAPMALFALEDAGGPKFNAAAERGMSWLLHAPELAGSLIDRAAGVIWRKVARHEPGKLTRGLQAVASRAHPAWRVPGVDGVFRPGKIDFETRPYHMGWLLYAWSQERLDRLERAALEKNPRGGMPKP